MSFLEIIHKLRRLMYQNQFCPDGVKITIEFLNPKDQYAAEMALKSQANLVNLALVNDICSGKEFTIMGVKMQVKHYRDPRDEYLPACDCFSCMAARANASSHIRPGG